MSGVHSGTIDVVRTVDELSSFKVEVAKDVGMAVLVDESLSIPVFELAG